MVRIIVGSLLVTGAVYLRRVSVSEFRKHAAVAASLAGQGLILASIHEITDSPKITAAALVALAVALMPVIQDSLHRFLSTLAASAGLYVMIIDDGLPGFEAVTIVLVIIVALVWRYRVGERSSKVASLLEPVGYATVVALFGALLAGTMTQLGNMSLDPGVNIRVGRATTIAVMVLLALFVWKINDEHRMSGTTSGFAAISGVLALGLATLSSPGIITGAAILALAHDRRNRVLLGMGIVFLLVFGSVYYYSLHITLLEKASVLVGSGLLLLAIRYRMVRA
jgi:uncharacterized membrane protein